MTLDEIVKIIKPEKWVGYASDLTRKHRWRHVAACRARIVGAVQIVADDVPIERGPGATDLKMSKVRKERAVKLAVDILSDFSNRRPTMTRKKDNGALDELASFIYAAATRESRYDLRHTMREHLRGDGWIGDDADGKGRPKVAATIEPPKELLDAIKNDPDLQERWKEWNRPRPKQVTNQTR